MSIDRLTIPTITFDDLKTKVENLISEAGSILVTTIDNEDECAAFGTRLKNWEANATALLKNSFTSLEYLHEFEQSARRMIVPGGRRNNPVPTVRTRANDDKQQLVAWNNWLQFNLAIWDQCDLIRGASVDVAVRNKYTVQQKLNFLLERLHALNNGIDYYPLDFLLVANGFRKFSTEELQGMADHLEQIGHIDVSGGLGTTPSAKITVSGQIYVEEELSQYKEDYSGISDDQASINGLIDHLKTELFKLSAGQEVLFEELEDLKVLYVKLTKKNWGEILKGKLMDMALDKVISKETLSFIFLTLTGHDIKLLS